ncbi:MAG: MarR family EPS-associated transcriptional regulator [Spirochaetia bacterium]|nr:MarR family EPS-associated transcriptional regulator [Spirochaetia bacterium]
MFEEEIHYKILKALEENPELSQRELAGKMKLSLGKVNFCVNALMEKGWIKVQNFKNSKNKLAYLYNLTPSGIEGKAKLTKDFLQRKMHEYDLLTKEIAQLQRESRVENAS